MPVLYGPFHQIITLGNLPNKGSLSDDQLEIIEDGGIAVEGDVIQKVAAFREFDQSAYTYHPINRKMVLLPGLIDCHTHMIWGGDRSRDYTMRMAGRTYQEILASGGGIFDSVKKTQEEDEDILLYNLIHRLDRHLLDGITTIEVKTGYGLLKEHETRLLKVIQKARSEVSADIVSTCLAAHVCPKDFEKEEFLKYLKKELLPGIYKKDLTRRVDIFVEENAFPAELAKPYLKAAKDLGFQLTVHADQFTTGGSELAVEMKALSADHLEASERKEIKMLAKSTTVPVALPGASLGLGMEFTPARKLLDAGASLAIATDWNPGSAPMGDLLVQASILGMYEKLSTAELLAGITFRAGAALGLHDRGVLARGKKADFIAFPFENYREIFYNQGKIKPSVVWKNGRNIQHY